MVRLKYVFMMNFPFEIIVVQGAYEYEEQLATMDISAAISLSIGGDRRSQ